MPKSESALSMRSVTAPSRPNGVSTSRARKPASPPNRRVNALSAIPAALAVMLTYLSALRLIRLSQGGDRKSWHEGVAIAQLSEEAADEDAGALPDVATTPWKAITSGGSTGLPKVILSTYATGHFEPYAGELFESFVAEQLGFLDKTLA